MKIACLRALVAYWFSSFLFFMWDGRDGRTKESIIILGQSIRDRVRGSSGCCFSSLGAESIPVSLHSFSVRERKGTRERGFFDGRKFVPVLLTYQHHRSVTY
jgi:hypothetical protein